MKRLAAGILGLVALLIGSVAEAQDRGIYSVSVLAGVSGAFDSNGERAFDHTARVLAVGMNTGEQVWTSIRLGSLALDDEELAVGRADGEIEYLSIAAENRFRLNAYTFGVFGGLGLYQLDALLLEGGREQKEALGLSLGFTGDFDITRRISIVAEVATHYVFFGETSFFGSALAGVAVHF